MLVQIWLLPVGMGRHGDGGDRALWTRIHQEVWVKKFSANCYPGDLKNLFREESEKAIARKKKSYYHQPYEWATQGKSEDCQKE